MKQYDIVVVGAGIIGCAAALALAKNTSLSIALLEANSLSFTHEPNQNNPRVSAISLASKKILHELSIWNEAFSQKSSPYTHMHVWDGEKSSEIYFDSREVNESALGYIVEDGLIRSSLLAELKKYSQVELLFPHKLTMINRNADDRLEIITDHSTFKTHLLIAADGANSIVRDKLNITLKTWDYGHTAMVTTVQTTLSHQQTARQVFLSDGPLAFLPLADPFTCSIVWSTSPEHIQQLQALNDEEFAETLSLQIQDKLGVIKKVETRSCFPLRMRHVQHYVQPNVALVGDAAHTIHPLAGQGVNMGLLDIMCLVDVITEANKKNRSFFSLATLRKYERQRKSDNFTMLAGVEMIHRLFTTENTCLKIARSAGLNLTNRLTWLKNFFARYALGYRWE